MASTFNLVRNSRVFFSTDVNANTGNLPTAAASMTTANTFELAVLDGFSFSQGTQQQTIQLTEAGTSPTRGQRAFNTSLDPVDFSFSTYIRPYFSTTVQAEEGVLWNALFGANAVDAGTAITITTLTRANATAYQATLTVSPAVNLTAAPALAIGDIINLGSFVPGTTAAAEWAGPAKITTATGGMGAATVLYLEYLTPPNAAATAAGIAGVAKIFKSPWFTQGTAVSQAAFAQVNAGMSNKNQLQKFGMYFYVDNALYAVDNCAMDSVSVDFSLDGIATAVWSGKATALRYISGGTVAANGTFSGSGHTGTAAAKVNIAPSSYITNKLSTVTLERQIMGSTFGADNVYNLALTGGNLTIANNISYVVPANLGVVNVPIGYYTGTRSISGNITAYLRTGTLNSAQILSDILTANAAETKFKTVISVGGVSNAVHVDFKMNGVLLQVPTVETGDVMGTTINFNAQGYDPSLLNAAATYDIGQTNEIAVNYFAV